MAIPTIATRSAVFKPNSFYMKNTGWILYRSLQRAGRNDNFPFDCATRNRRASSTIGAPPLKLLETCKGNGGPLTKKSLNKLNKLTEKKLLAEISDLRATIAPDIRQNRRVKIDGKFKMVNFTTDELSLNKKSSETRKRYHCQRG